MMTAVEFRRLAPSDLDGIQQIEQRATRPRGHVRCSPAKLAKPGGFCVGAFQGEEMLGRRDRRQVRRRVAHHEHRGGRAVSRRGVARVLLEHLFSTTEDDADRGYTLEVRVSNAARDPSLRAARIRQYRLRRGYYTDNREDAVIMWRDHLE